MRIDITGNIDRVTRTDPNTDDLIPGNFFIYAEPGAGKSTVQEQIANTYYRNGYKIIDLFDPKDTLEGAYTAFPAEEQYHVKECERFGCPIGSISTQILHPFTFYHDPRKRIPGNVNFYTLNIKELSREDFQFFAGSEVEKGVVNILLQTLKTLKKNEGLHHAVFYAENQTESVAQATGSKLRLRSDDSKMFFSKGKKATEKVIPELQGYFDPFQEMYALTPETCRYNLDYEAILNDQKTITVFSVQSIDDEKMRTWFTYHLFKQFIKNIHKSKYPIMFIIREIPNLTPNKTDGYEGKLSKEIAKDMRKLRSMGSSGGNGCILDAQIFSTTSKDVLGACNEKVLGKTTSPAELNFIKKALSLNMESFTALQSLEVGWWLIQKEGETQDRVQYQRVKFFMPPHAHKELKSNYIKLYEKHYGRESFHTIEEMYTEMRQIRDNIMQDVRQMAEAENTEKKRKEEQMTQPKQPNEVKERLEKVTEQKKDLTTQRKNAIINYAQENPRASLANIAKHFNQQWNTTDLHKMKIKRVLDSQKKKQEATNDTRTNIQTIQPEKTESQN